MLKEERFRDKDELGGVGTFKGEHNTLLPGEGDDCTEIGDSEDVVGIWVLMGHTRLPPIKGGRESSWGRWLNLVGLLGMIMLGALLTGEIYTKKTVNFYQSHLTH